MPGMEDFLSKLDQNPTQALAEYHLVIDGAGLDKAAGEVGVLDQVDVALDFVDGDVTLRAMTAQDSTRNSLRIWYLPWTRWVTPAEGVASEVVGMSRADLEGAGPGIFLTSQLTGCRFTIQYHSGDMKKATVLHLAGNYGENKVGAQKREELERQALQGVPSVVLRRRYSIGKYSRKAQFAPFPLDGVRTYYGGGMSTVLGVRGRDDKWKFFAEEYNNMDDKQYLGVKEL